MYYLLYVCFIGATFGVFFLATSLGDVFLCDVTVSVLNVDLTAVNQTFMYLCRMFYF